MGVYTHIIIYLLVHYPPMPTKQRAEGLQDLISRIRDGEFEYEEREPGKTDWAKYDQAQVEEAVNYIENVRDLVDEADRRIKARSPPERRGPGRPPVEAADIAKVLLMQTYTNSPNRVAEGLLLIFREKLGIARHFSYKTIERGYDRKAVNEILDEVTRIINETVEGKEKRFAFDGTGFSGSTKENYAEKRRKQNAKRKEKKSRGKKRTGKRQKGGETGGKGDKAPSDAFPSSDLGGARGFTYALTGVGVRYKVISGSVICPNQSIGETTMFPEAFERTLASHPGMDAALGDGVFAARPITDLVWGNHVRPYFLPRRNVRFKSQGFSGWAPMLQALYDEPQEWLRAYHMRSIAETVNSMIKARFGAPLRKRLEARRKTETQLKLMAHNVRWSGYLEDYMGVFLRWPRHNMS
jgi:transposase